MKLLKRILKYFLGFLPRNGDDDPPNNRPQQEEEEEEEEVEEATLHGHVPTINAPSVQVCDHLGPVLSPRSLGQGGVQGLNWYAKRLKMDEDGDVADEFLHEVVVPVTSRPGDRRPVPKFRVQQSTLPVKVRKQMVTDGDILQGVDHNGKLQWV